MSNVSILKNKHCTPSHFNDSETNELEELLDESLKGNFIKSIKFNDHIFY